MLKTLLLLNIFWESIKHLFKYSLKKRKFKRTTVCNNFCNNNIDVLNATFDQYNAALLKYLFLKKTKFDTKCIIISIIYCITIIICIFLKVTFLLNFIWVVFGIR